MTSHHDFSKTKVMKRNTYILLLIFISQVLLAQKKGTEKANKFFAEKAYYEAAKLYKELKTTQSYAKIIDEKKQAAANKIHLDF